MRLSLSAIVASALIGFGFAEPGVSPATVVKEADPGTSFNINKIVTTALIPPNPEIVLLVDVTGSMTPTLANIKENLKKVIDAVNDVQPNAKFAVVSFGDLKDYNGFKVVQDLTTSEAKLVAAVDSLKADLGGDIAEDWIYALHKVATDSISFTEKSSKIIVLVGDATSHDPSGGISLGTAKADLVKINARVIGVNVGNLDEDGKASDVTSATGGIIIDADPKKVSDTIVSGLKNLDVTIEPTIVSCDAGLAVVFSPAQITVSSGTTTTFLEAAHISSLVDKGKSYTCTVSFHLNGVPGGDAFVQKVTVHVPKKGCYTCDPTPGKNKCHITTSCTNTPSGTMCLTRPGFKADGAADDDLDVQWRLKWPGHEHRVAVKPGTSSFTLCSSKYVGNDVCKEVSVSDCKKTLLDNTKKLGAAQKSHDQKGNDPKGSKQQGGRRQGNRQQGNGQQSNNQQVLGEGDL